jgi:hypothetical protein
MSENGPPLQFMPSTLDGRFRDVRRLHSSSPIVALGARNSDCYNFLQGCNMWRTLWRILALPDEDFLVAALHTFDGRRKTMGRLKRFNALFASLALRSFALNERLHFIIN